MRVDFKRPFFRFINLGELCSTESTGLVVLHVNTIIRHLWAAWSDDGSQSGRSSPWPPNAHDARSIFPQVQRLFMKILRDEDEGNINTNGLHDLVFQSILKCHQDIGLRHPWWRLLATMTGTPSEHTKATICFVPSLTIDALRFVIAGTWWWARVWSKFLGSTGVAWTPLRQKVTVVPAPADASFGIGVIMICEQVHLSWMAFLSEQDPRCTRTLQIRLEPSKVREFAASSWWKSQFRRLRMVGRSPRTIAQRLALFSPWHRRSWRKSSAALFFQQTLHGFPLRWSMSSKGKAQTGLLVAVLLGVLPPDADPWSWTSIHHRTGTCLQRCRMNIPKRQDEAASRQVALDGVTGVQPIILSGSPVHTAYTVYSDFGDYGGGVYHHVSTTCVPVPPFPSSGSSSSGRTCPPRSSSSWSPRRTS